MKKTYDKPLIYMEDIAMDQPIAANCTMRHDDVEALMEWGYFTAERACSITLLSTGGFDFNGDGKADIHDTICYHSNVQTAFLS